MTNRAVFEYVETLNGGSFPQFFHNFPFHTYEVWLRQIALTGEIISRRRTFRRCSNRA